MKNRPRIRACFNNGIKLPASFSFRKHPIHALPLLSNETRFLLLVEVKSCLCLEGLAFWISATAALCGGVYESAE